MHKTPHKTTLLCKRPTQSWKPDCISAICTFDACCRQSWTNSSATARLAHVSLTRPGCIFLSRNLILSVNIDLSSEDNDAIILEHRYILSYQSATTVAVTSVRHLLQHLPATH